MVALRLQLCDFGFGILGLLSYNVPHRALAFCEPFPNDLRS